MIQVFIQVFNIQVSREHGTRMEWVEEEEGGATGNTYTSLQSRKYERGEIGGGGGEGETGGTDQEGVGEREGGGQREGGGGRAKERQTVSDYSGNPHSPHPPTPTFFVCC